MSFLGVLQHGWLQRGEQLLGVDLQRRLRVHELERRRRRLVRLVRGSRRHRRHKLVLLVLLRGRGGRHGGLNRDGLGRRGVALLQKLQALVEIVLDGGEGGDDGW